MLSKACYGARCVVQSHAKQKSTILFWLVVVSCRVLLREVFAIPPCRSVMPVRDEVRVKKVLLAVK